MTLKTLEAKKVMIEKKNEMKQAMWQTIRDLEERRLALEEKKAMTYLVAEENRTIMMDPNTMDAFTRKWWDMRRLEIITRRKLACVEASATVDATRGGGDGASATASGGVAGCATGGDGVA